MNWGVVAYSLFFIFVAMQRVSKYRLSKKGIGEKTTKLLENRTEMLNRTQEKKIWSCDCAALGSSGVQSTVGSILGLFHCSSLIQTYGIVKYIDNSS